MTRGLFASASVFISTGIALAIPGLVIAAVGMQLLDLAEHRQREAKGRR